MTKELRILNRFNVGGPTYNAAYLTKYLSKEYETKLIGGIKEDAEARRQVLEQLERDKRERLGDKYVTPEQQQQKVYTKEENVKIENLLL